jgi:dTDP-4-amino-4,6-dideoxygalactose transaminase
MPNLNAALACAQLEQLDCFLQKKSELAIAYQSFFSCSSIKFRTQNPNTKANYWLMCVELENRKERDLFLRETNANKIMTRPIWQLMFRLPMYANCQRDEQLNAIFLEDRIVNLPSSVRV